MSLKRTKDGWFCPGCGLVHEGLIMCFGPDEPHGWFRAKRLDRLRGRLAESFCEVNVDGRRRYYVRGHLPLPVVDGDGSPFLWNVWAEVEPDHFSRMVDALDDPGRVGRPPVPGLLDTPLPSYPDTQGLPTQIVEQAVGQVPRITVEAPGHPLHQDQVDGVTLHRVADLNAFLLGPGR